MGASNSRVEEDKGLQLCGARKKFIKQALNGRCSLAAAHVAYIQQLKIIGAALRQFVGPDNAQVETSAHGLSENCATRLSVSSQSQSRNVDKTANTSPSPSPRVSSQFHSHPMRFGVTVSKKIEEKLPEVSLLEAHSVPSDEAPPWDYFGLFHPMDDHSERTAKFGQGSDCSDEHIREEEGIPDLEQQSQESEDEFNEPSSASLVRSFKNVNTKKDEVVSVTEARSDVINGDSPVRPSDGIITANKFADDVKITAVVESKVEDEVAPKDFFSSMNDIEQLFVKASQSGKEVPRMLEANKFHFRPVFRGKEGGSIASSLLKAFFSCGNDPIEVQQEPPQNPANYLTWHRTTSFHSASSRDLLITNHDHPNNNLFDNFCMVSGSHASTLDRLYAWEKKLYDEVKAGQVLKSNFDRKCKLLRQKESRGVNADKTRAAVKDLHSRISVAIHRINSISKEIEEIRDMELQPQLEELIEGLRKMWEMMVECHKLQVHIVSISQTPSSTNMKTQPDSQRQITIHLCNELSSLSFTFVKWISTQKIYVDAIDKWLLKCVSLPQNPSKRNKRMKPPLLRNCGPPIYMICGAWSEMIRELPSEGVADSLKELAAQVARFLPRQDKNAGKDGTMSNGNMEVVVDRRLHLDSFRTGLARFLGQLNSFAECSLKMFTELQKAIEDAKGHYEGVKSQRSQVFS